MDRLPEGIDSRFRYVLLVSKRAEQIVQGAAPKARSRFAKPTRVAMDELAKGLVNWKISTEAAEEPAEPMPELAEME